MEISRSSLDQRRADFEIWLAQALAGRKAKEE
jgi:hypothetical protein